MEVFYTETDINPSESLTAARMRVKRESGFIRELMDLCDRHCVRCAPLELQYMRRAPEELPTEELPKSSRRAPAFDSAEASALALERL